MSHQNPLWHRSFTLAASLLLPLLLILLGCRTHDISPLTPIRLSLMLELDQERMEEIRYQQDIQPLFNSRCVSCHACYDAPAQLKLTSAEGVTRGATKQRVYTTRVTADIPTRLGKDAESEEEWRELGFFSVLPNPDLEDPRDRLDASVMYQMIAMSRLRKLPDGGLLDAIVKDDHDIPMAPTIEEFPNYIEQFPHAGMPFYTYGLEEEEFQTLALWIANGAKVEAPDGVFSAQDLERFRPYEELLNGDDLKTQLAARYLYEHLFSARLYFEDENKAEFFKIVRSRTAPGTPVDPIFTRRPNDDPGVERVYYRFLKYNAEIIRKNHLPYGLSENRLNRWKELFWETQWEVETLPAYSVEAKQNPFEAFLPIPERSRFQFMLDDSLYFVQSFMRGPVCRGQVALNGIWDHFFVYFMDPEMDPSVSQEAFIREALPHLTIPLGLSGKGAEAAYTTTTKRIHRFQEHQDEALLALTKQTGGLSLDDIWLPEDLEENPVLTVYRHFDTASVSTGFVGNTPDHGWFVDYTLLERIYYLLVVNYDVFGPVHHQLSTRLYFDLLRFEGEANYLRLFPPEQRDDMFSEWYRGISLVNRELHYPDTNISNPTAITFEGDRDVRDQLRRMVGERLVSKVEDPSLARFTETYAHATQFEAPFVQFFPEVVFLRVRYEDGDHGVVTILRNKAFLNVSGLFDEKKRRLPDQDSIMFVQGLIGDYPNMMMDLREDQLDAFSEDLNQITTEDEMVAFLIKYGVLRTSKEFWPLLDWFTEWEKTLNPIQAGRFDLKHYYLTRLLSLGDADLVK